MKTEKELKLNLVYIGDDTLLINEFSGKPDLFALSNFKNPLQASEWFQKKLPIDGIVCELEIPGINGLDYHKTFVNDFDTKSEIPYLLLTKSKNKELMQQALLNKVADIYVKPVDVNTIYNRIKFLKVLKLQTKPKKEFIKRHSLNGRLTLLLQA
jgi:response regulator RpfG family c-di-GMP phosphodiesterase